MGRYAAARPVADAVRERVLAEFEERGVSSGERAELRAAVPGLSQREADKRVKESIELGWMRFRCPVSSVAALEPSEHIELPERLQNGGLS